MLGGGLGLVMTGETSPLGQGGRVTGGTRAICTAMLPGESVRAVVRCAPIGRGVAGGAIGAKKAGMVGRFSVTAGTGGGGSPENTRFMAGAAELVLMGAGQGES